jgi:hypothetical protein
MARKRLEDSGEGQSKAVRVVTRNLASSLARIRVKPEALTDEDIQLLAMELILDQDQWDEGTDAQRSKVKLDALKFIHEVRKDSKPVEDATASDFEVWKVKSKG